MTDTVAQAEPPAEGFNQDWLGNAINGVTERDFWARSLREATERADKAEAALVTRRADTLAEVDALLHDGLRFDQWTARIPHPGRPGYVFADERRYLARFIADELGGVKGDDGEPDVVADLRRCRETTEEQS